jgi:hypothetical protein
MKKAWEKPKIIVLYRGRPEECVLAACKTGVTVLTGPGLPKCTHPVKGSCLVNSST